LGVVAFHGVLLHSFSGQVLPEAKKPVSISVIVLAGAV